MAEVNLENIYKMYSNGEIAIKNLDLTIEHGEFLVLVGPSGCGKSTILRMLAGLEEISGGTLRINGEKVNHKSPQKRNIAMVFQNYALYPHLTVEENIAVPLRIQKKSSREIKKRVLETCQNLELTDLLTRKPKQLSGGQQQRVAMGRAIVRDPQVLLMDEPLSNLDAKMRVEIRTKIAQLQREKGVTTVYVTHDQVEAMTLGDRVAVLFRGELQQVDSPDILYQKPANTFVANFIGSPAMNIFHTSLHTTENGQLTIEMGRKSLEIAPIVAERYVKLDSYLEQPILAGLRPEAFSLNPSPDSKKPNLEITVQLVENWGHENIIYFDIPLDHYQSASDRSRYQENSRESPHESYLTARFPSHLPVKEGEKLNLEIDTNQLYLFQANGESLEYSKK